MYRETSKADPASESNASSESEERDPKLIFEVSRYDAKTGILTTLP